MATARQQAAEQKKARRDRERDARKADRERLRSLRAHIKAAKKHAVHRRREVALLCKRGRATVRETAKKLRAAARAELLASIDAERAKSRGVCNARRDQARSKNADSLRRAQASLEAEAKHVRTMRIWSKPQKSVVARARRNEAIAESDSEVRNNIPADLVPVFNAVKAKIKATARRTRSEAFVEWAAEHQAQVIKILDAQIHADVEALVREEARLRREVRMPSTYRKSCDAGLNKRKAAYRSAEAVPF
jgi:hypothetical protein